MCKALTLSKMGVDDQLNGLIHLSSNKVHDFLETKSEFDFLTHFK